jgi:hypothetical protein
MVFLTTLVADKTSRTLAGHIEQENPAGEKAMNAKKREEKFQQFLEGINVAFDFGGLLVPSRRRLNPGFEYARLQPGQSLLRALFDSVKQLRRTIRRIGAKRVFLIKLVKTPDEEAHFYHWLERKRIYKRTGLLLENVRVCDSRDEKAKLCLELHIDMMVDDRYEVFDGFHQLGDRAAHIMLVAFKPDPDERARYTHLYDRVTDVDTWGKIYSKIAAESLARRKLRGKLKQT